jgi:Outer membrane protein Omp28
MKSTKYIFIYVLASLMLLPSCDIIELPDTASLAFREDLYGTPAQPPAISDMIQRVLLEDFTGHQCGNCPEAHIVAAEILDAHPEHIALVAIHAGSLAGVFGPYTSDWTTPEGEFYLFSQIGSDQLPTGRINRVGGANSSSNFAQWQTQVTEQLAEIPQADLAISTELEIENNHINVHIRTKYGVARTGNIKLTLMFAEGPIIAPQLNYDADPELITDYEHKHMLRGTGTGATGLVVASNPTTNQEDVIHYTLPWSPTWDPQNFELIGFLTDGESGEVINVRKIDLVP